LKKKEVLSIQEMLPKKTRISKKETCRNLKTEPNTRANGSSQPIFDRDTEFKSGQTGRSMKVGGETIKQTGEGASFMQTATSSKEIGKMIRLMGMVFILISMERSMKVHGKKIDRMGKELRLGPTMLAIRASTKWVKNMVLGDSNGLMGLRMRALSLRIIFMERESINGLTVDVSRETGRITRWTGEEFSIGLIRDGMRENTRMIKRKGRDILHGLTGGSI
jgi:hypothetical protein